MLIVLIPLHLFCNFMIDIFDNSSSHQSSLYICFVSYNECFCFFHECIFIHLFYNYLAIGLITINVQTGKLS